MKFQNFDNAYLERLRGGDPRTQKHFVNYFTELLNVKLRSRLRSPEDREDASQETFVRVFAALRKKDGIREPERIGAFVNSVCNNVLRERYRAPASESLEARHMEIRDRSVDVTELIAHKQTQHKLRGILDELSERDRRIIREIFFEERSRDRVCREQGANRGYLRVLVHRAKQALKSQYVRSVAISNRSRFQTIARCPDGVH
jgi:RNA polymerase sigma-70 factor (ECF subfamily)